LKNKVMKKDDLVNENRALKRTIDDLKRKVEDLETKNKDSVTPAAENVEVYYYRPKHLLRRTRY